MDKHYSQLTLKERKEIEAGLDRGDPSRGIASLIGRQPSTVSREVRENRHVRAYKARRSACRGRNWCKRVGVCAECVREGAYCAGCDARKPTPHSPKRSHGEFEKLPGERKGARTEPDSVVGRAVDAQAVLTLYNLPDRSVAMSAVLPGASKSRNGLPSFSNKIVDTWTCAYEPLSRKMTVAWSP